MSTKKDHSILWSSFGGAGGNCTHVR